MEKMYKKLLKHRFLVLAVFLVGAVASLYISTKVQINYNLVDYLPAEAASTVALDVMEESYEKSVPNVRVMVPNVTIPQALEYKEKLGDIPGVSDINWLDNLINIKVPLETQDQKTVEDWYLDKNALFSLVVEEENRGESLDQIRAIIGEDGAMSGLPVDAVDLQRNSKTEMAKMMSIIVPLIIVILLFTTTSWIDPFLFIFNVGIAIALNMGTNILLGEISFITQTTSAILQLACSMDYAIFLLDRFAEYRMEISDPVEAMAKAASHSVNSILSSGSTTIVGFLALCIMQFTIGADMGLVLAKGIIFSLLSTLVFMPCLSVCLYKLIDKTSHRSFLPSFRKLGVVADKTKNFVAIAVAILVVPCYLAQNNISFIYGMDNMAQPDSVVGMDKAKINDTFGKSQSFAIMVPKGELAKEKELAMKIKDLPETASVMSFTETIGTTIPSEFLPQDKLELLNSQDYTRLVISARIPPESEETFAYVETLRDITGSYYDDTYHLAGEVANVYDMRETITADNVKVNLVSILGIAIVLLLTFRSISIPLILLITIESSIFINVAIPYFTGLQLNYIGFLIISSVQLGATVDYAILYTDQYITNRKQMVKKKAVSQTISDTAGSILTSGGILTSAGLVLGFVSTNSVVSQLGILVARGAALSALLVLILLPALLAWCDKIIEKTSYKLTFQKAEKKEKHHKDDKDKKSTTRKEAKA